MTKLALGALIALVACGGDGSKGKPDGATADAPATLTCDVLTGSGCTASQKCTWIVDQSDPAYLGHIGCAPAGSAAIDATCTFGNPGMTGYDDCVKGAVCSSYKHPGTPGICKAVCDQSGGDPKCDSSHLCTVYPKLFATGASSPAAAGVCNAKCNPLLDNDFDGSGSSSTKRANGPCGSDVTTGCYGLPDRGSLPKTGWTCMEDLHAHADGTDLNLRHRTQCTTANGCLDDTGHPYVNSCNQGYEPVLYEMTGSTTFICVAICHPLDCYNGNCGGIGNPNRHGQYPDTCNSVQRGGVFQTGSGREECQYQWGFEVGSAGGAPLLSDTSNAVGFCMDHYLYKYDPTGGNNPTTPYPGCEALQLRGTHNPADPPNVFWGASDWQLACVNATLALGSGSATGKLPEAPGVTVDGPRFLSHRVMTE